ncbi:MAG: DUF4166 domain-containing protein [Alphaproteobacteria bacterium]|nr:DUF4166 domain-containing protein [Alphaproteobacteria bacterium]
MRRILVIGGTGGFGRRLVEGLIATSDAQVIIATRHREPAEMLVRTLPRGRATSVILDVRTVSADALRGLDISAVVDVAGPYQGADYRLARAAVAAGVHYLDLADARDFVTGIVVLDDMARGAGVVVLSGASSTPALSHAVLDRLTAGWRWIDRVEIAISPGNRASPRGLAVLRSILSYAGRSIRVFDGGAWVARPGWGMPVRRDMPGLGRRWLSLCETPDLDLVPQRFAPREAALFRAGLELSVMHLGLLAATFLVRSGMMRSLLPFARPLQWAAERLRGVGSDRGGMIVEATGCDAGGRPVRALWSLVAGKGDGPFVPTLPARAALRLLHAGGIPSGARPCVGVLDLDDIEREFSLYDIKTEISVAELPLPFQRLLGAGFGQIPEPVRRVHSLTQPLNTSGKAEITSPRNPLARLLCRLAGLPRPGTDVPVSVRFQPDGRGGEYWRRRFTAERGGERRYASTMQAGDGDDAGLLVERFWPFIYYHRLTPSAAGVAWRLVRWKLLGIALPRFTLPTVDCFEAAQGERYTFDINVVFPLVGPVIHYRGWLVPV